MCGIKVKISSIQNTTYKSMLQNRNYELIIGGTNIGLSPELDTYLGENNIANYTNEEVKTILNDIANIKDENLLKEKYKRLAEIYKNESPYKSLYMNRKNIIYSSKLMGDVTPNSYNIFYNIENWYREI